MKKATRNTKQKKMIIEFLRNNPNIHLSIQDIKNGINDDIGLTTIYRIINQLVETGEIIKQPLENTQGFCYQFNEKTDKCSEEHHYHLICEECNKLEHYENKEISKINKDIEKDLNFKVNGQRIVFFGKCKECE